MGLTAYLVLGGVVLFAGASFFFAVAESALFALGKWQARQMAEAAGGRLVLRLLERPAELLATLALGNTVANGAIVALASWPALSGQWPALWTWAGIAALILIGCEIVPKTLAVRAPERWARGVARPIWLLQSATSGLQQAFQSLNGWLLRRLVRQAPAAPGLSEEEYRELVDLAFQQGTLARSEKDIILQIISLDRKTAKEVMRPRSQMAFIPDDLSVPEMVAAARRLRHRRLPLYDRDEDTIVGVLNTSALLLDPELDLAEAIEPPAFVPESMNLLRLLNSLERQRRSLTLVLDEFGGLAGLVTIEDIMGEVVGRLGSEVEPAGVLLHKLGEGRWRAHGLLRLDEFRREYPALAEVPGIETLGGLLVAELGVVPAAGESAVVQGLKLTAAAVDERRVKELLVEVVRAK